MTQLRKHTPKELVTKQILTNLILTAHKTSVSKGFYKDKRPNDERIMLIISELGEAIEAHRKGKFADLLTFGDSLVYDEKVSIGEWNPSENHQNNLDIASSFEKLIKDSMEDELADAMIRMFDFLGYLESERNMDIIYNSFVYITDNYKRNNPEIDGPLNAGVLLLDITKMVCNYSVSLNPGLAGEILGLIYMYSVEFNFNLMQHVNYKMQYNATRAALHGKKY